MHFGATLRLLRLESGLSLRDLARRLSVSGAYLSRVEHGLDSVPTAARLEAIARELAVPPTLLMSLAHRVSPLVVDYVQAVPTAGALFLEIAHRRLDERQLAELRRFLDERFPNSHAGPPGAAVGIADLLALGRVVLRFTCADLDDALDVAAGRIADEIGQSGAAIGAPLKQREREVVSAIGSGVAIPCVYIERCEPLAVLITLATPLEYDTPDRAPLRVVIVIAGPRDSPDRRFRLAHIAGLAARGLADELAEIDSPTELLARLARFEGRDEPI